MARNTPLYEESIWRYEGRPMLRRAAYSAALVVAVLLIGTAAFHYVEGYSYVNAFYFMSMLATAEGPTIAPVTVLGKLLASFFAFVSVGSVIFALAFLFGPFLGKVLRLEERKLSKDELMVVKRLHERRRRNRQ